MNRPYVPVAWAAGLLGVASTLATNNAVGAVSCILGAYGCMTIARQLNKSPALAFWGLCGLLGWLGVWLAYRKQLKALPQ